MIQLVSTGDRKVVIVMVVIIMVYRDHYFLILFFNSPGKIYVSKKYLFRGIKKAACRKLTTPIVMDIIFPALFISDIFIFNNKEISFSFYVKLIV